MKSSNLKKRPTGLLLPAFMACIALLFAAGTAWGVGFGELSVNSYLNQPFDATVEVLGAEDANNLTVELAGPSRYQNMGLSAPRNLASFGASLSLVDGRNVIRLNSRLPVTDLVVDLVLIMNADGNESIRHYPIIIDFAPQLDGVVVSPTPEPVSQPPVPVRVPEPRRVAAVRSNNSYGPVLSGQTLSGIVAEIAGDQAVNGFEFMQAIVDLNPQAFANGDMNRMRAGVDLTLPELDGFAPRTLTPQPQPQRPSVAPVVNTPVPASAGAEPAVEESQAAIDSAAAAAAEEASRLELVGTPTSGEILNSLNRWMDEDDQELGLRAQEARRDLAYATAEIETYRKENDVLKGRVSELEGRIETLRKLIALRSTQEPEESVDDAAGAVEASPVATQAAPAGAPAAENVAAPVSVESDLAAVSDNAGSNPETVNRGLGWWPWALGIAVLLILTLVVWYRGRREDQARAQRTADLVHRIQQAGKRNTSELDIPQ